MILVGNQRGGARDLAQHLLKEENERVRVHELRGFVADDLHGALVESYAVSRGTQCRQHLYSLSLNPPADETVGVEVFEDAVERVEKRLGLDGQPRAIVFHEKNGRRHAHAVWSRIDTDAMKAVQLSYSNSKLNEVSREIYIERGWQMPRGFINREFTDPRNFSLAEWQQAKRAGKDPRQTKEVFQDCWALSDSRAGFAHALEERGLILAKGDRRGFVAVDHTGEVYAVARWVGLKTKQVKARLGGPDGLPSVDEAHARAAGQITVRLQDLRHEQARAALEERERLQRERRATEHRQKVEAARLAASQRDRRECEVREREARLRRGWLGLWDRLTGKRQRSERGERRCRRARPSTRSHGNFAAGASAGPGGQGPRREKSRDTRATQRRGTGAAQRHTRAEPSRRAQGCAAAPGTVKGAQTFGTKAARSALARRTGTGALICHDPD